MLRARSRLVESFDHILSSDPAVDKEAEGFTEKWEAYLDGAGPPPLKDGEKPCIWTLKILGTKEQLRLSEWGSRTSEDRHAFPGMIAAAFALGLRGVDGLCDEMGKKIELMHRDDRGLAVVDDKFLDHLESSWVFELGGRVLARMNASPK